MGFKTFDFVHNGSSLKIRCHRCDAGIVDYFQDPDQKIYRAKGWKNKVNDCRTDVDLTCNNCGNSESAEGLNILFIGK